MPENTALIDEIMTALDAENSTNVELIVRNTQNGVTKKMPLASLEQIIYNYLTSSSVAAQLASVLGVPAAFYKNYQNLSSLITGINDGNNLYIVPEVITISADRDETILRYLCNRYPSTVAALYIGRFSYGTQGFFAIMIYSTNDIVSTTNLPRYSFGLLCQWSGVFNFFNTSEGVLSTLWSAT